MFRTTTLAFLMLLLIACGGGGGGSGGQDPDGIDTGNDTGTDLPDWPEGQLLQVDTVTLQGGTDEPATVQVNGSTVAESSTSFQATYQPDELGLPGTYTGGERPAPMVFDIRAADAADQVTEGRVEVAIEP